MKQAAKIIAWCFAVVWAAITFMASNSPADVQQRAGSWASLPLLKALPAWLFSVASSPITLSISFFLLGCAVGGFATKRLGSSKKSSRWERLGSEVSMVAYAIDNMSHVYSNPAVTARMNVVINKLAAAGIEVPPMRNALDQDRVSFYLHQVAAYLDENDEAAAKSVARSIVKQWPAEVQETSFLGG